MTSTREPTTGEKIVAAFLFIDEHDRSYRGLSEAIDAALAQREAAVRAEERASCANAARTAKLPRGYQWGRDAMEQFNFGKECAALAIEKRTGECL